MKKTGTEIVADLFRELQQKPDGPQVKRKIAILSTPRSGSKHFCLALANSGRFGLAMEWLGKPWMDAYSRLLGDARTDLGSYLFFLMAKTTSANGVFALNIHIDQYTALLKQNLDILQLNFDKIYYLYREDKLSQALSLAKARASDCWSSLERGQHEIDSAAISNSAIATALQDLCRQEAYYQDNLARHTDRAFRYEDFTTSDTAFRQIFSDNEIQHHDIDAFSSGLAIQRKGADSIRLSEFKNYLGCR